MKNTLFRDFIFMSLILLSMNSNMFKRAEVRGTRSQ